MVVIYGTRKMQKCIAATQALGCSHCGGVYSFKVMRLIKFFTLFWIPLIPYSFTYYLVCPACGTAVQIDKQAAMGYKNAVLEYQNPAPMIENQPQQWQVPAYEVQNQLPGYQQPVSPQWQVPADEAQNQPQNYQPPVPQQYENTMYR